MNQRRSLFAVVATAGLALALTLVTSVAEARVSWSVGIDVPGVAIGVAAPQPYYYAPPPVYYAPPQPVYAPPPVYYRQPRPVYYAPPVVVAPPVVYYRGGYGHGYGHRDRHDRYDRHDRRRDWR